jgi:ABC-type Fe3+/spermidine/putrescine transport system ATPase subunit
MSDRVAVMNAGHIEQIGAPADIYERPASRFVAEFIGRMNFFPGRIASEGGRLVVRTAHAPALALPMPPGAADGAAVNIAIRPERAHVSFDAARGDGYAAQGRVDQILYLGSTREIRLTLENGGRATVEAPNAGAHAGPGPGDAVWFTAPLEACLVLLSGARS